MKQTCSKLSCLFDSFKKVTLFVWVTFFSTSTFAITGDITPCFTPGGACDQLIISEINKEPKSVLVQAYQLTSADIAKALVDAKRRGAVVKIILDKTQYTQKRYSSAIFFDHMGIPVWIDGKPAIAHNKIIILGNSEVITGSYNFSRAAQQKNAENLLIIKSKPLAAIYTDNFKKRLSASQVLSDYAQMKKNREESGTHKKLKNNNWF